MPSAPTRWYSVFVNGVPNYSNEEMLSPIQSEYGKIYPLRIYLILKIQPVTIM